MAVNYQSYNIGDNVTPNGTNTAATGTAVTVNAFTSTGTALALDAAAFDGSGQGCRFSATNGETGSHQWVKTGATTFSGRVAFRINSSTPSAAYCLKRIRSSSANVMKIVRSATNVVSLQNSAGTGIKNFNGGSALSDGWYVLCYQGTIATSTTGTLAAQLYDATATSVDSYSSSTVNLGTANATTAQWGHPESSGTVVQDLDMLAFNTGSTTSVGFDGTVVAPASSVTVTAPAPAVSGELGAVDGSVSAVAASVVVSAPAPTVDVEVTVSGAAPIGITVTALAPSVSGGAVNASVGAVAASVAVSAVAPGVSAQLVPTVAATPVSVVVSAVAPEVAGVAHATVAAVASTITATAIAPSFSAGVSVNTTAVAATLAITAPAPAVAGQRQPTVAAVAAVVTVTGPAPTPFGQRRPPPISAVPATIGVLGLAAVLTGQRQVTIEPPAAGISLEVIPPDVAAGIEVTVVVPAALLTVQALRPTAWIVLPYLPAERRMRVAYESRTMQITYSERGSLMRIPEHDPDATLPYQWDFAVPDLLGRTWLGSETITDATVTTTADGVVITDVIHDDTKVSATVSTPAAIPGTMVQLTCHITTSGGKVDDRTMLVRIKDR